MNVTGSPLSLKGWLIAGLIVLSIVALVGWRCSSKRAETANTDRRVAEAQVEAGQGAAEITAGQIEAEGESRALDAQNSQEIGEAENANEDAGDAGRAGLRSLCRRMPSNPRCRD